MGIYDRDYYRQGGSGEPIPPVCKYLIVITVAVFVLQILATRPTTPEDLRALREPQRPRAQKGLPSEKRNEPRTADDTTTANQDEKKPVAEEEEDGPFLPDEFLPSVSRVQEWCQLDTDKVVYRGQLWRLLTCAFCHDRFSVWHILINMLFLYWFGRMLEPLYGSREFLLFYLTAAVVASACHVALDLFTHHSVPALGASGAVMAVVVLYAIHHPRDKICIFMLFPIEIRWLVLLYVILDLHPVLLALSGTPQYTGVANAAHLGGAAFGFLYWRYGWHLEDTWERLRRLGHGWRGRLPRHARPSRRSRDSGPADLDALVDKILQKVQQEGEASLTDVEREVLHIAAQRYRGREKPPRKE